VVLIENELLDLAQADALFRSAGGNTNTVDYAQSARFMQRGYSAACRARYWLERFALDDADGMSISNLRVGADRNAVPTPHIHQGSKETTPTRGVTDVHSLRENASRASRFKSSET